MISTAFLDWFKRSGFLERVTPHFFRFTASRVNPIIECWLGLINGLLILVQMPLFLVWYFGILLPIMIVVLAITFLLLVIDIATCGILASDGKGKIGTQSVSYGAIL